MSTNTSHSRRNTLLAIAVIILAGLLVPTYVAYRRDIGRAYDRISTGSQIVQSRCGPLEFAAVGEVTGVVRLVGSVG